VNNHLESSFSGIKLVKSYVMEERSNKRFHGLMNERVEQSIRALKNEAQVGILFSAVSEISIFMVLLVGGILVIKRQLTLGEFVAFNAYALMLIEPMFDIGNIFVAGKRVQSGSDRILALREFPADVKEPLVGLKIPAQSTLTLSGVGFRYQPNSGEILKNINMVFKPGSKVGIAGTVGSGKSTIIRLLLRLADPTDGKITLNGNDIREFDLKELHRLFGYVPQETHLFSDTVRNNITFGREPESEEKLWKVISISQLETELKEFPKGIEELIGERGIKLSGGQRERIAIARALLVKPRILLFDDATSNLDSQTEKDLINQVHDFAGDSTLIIISHRLSILSICDLVYVMNKGEIVESGTHEELLSKRNLYRKLYERQIIAEEMDRL